MAAHSSNKSARWGSKQAVVTKADEVVERPHRRHEHQRYSSGRGDSRRPNPRLCDHMPTVSGLTSGPASTTPASPTSTRRSASAGWQPLCWSQNHIGPHPDGLYTPAWAGGLRNMWNIPGQTSSGSCSGYVPAGRRGNGTGGCLPYMLRTFVTGSRRSRDSLPGHGRLAAAVYHLPEFQRLFVAPGPVIYWALTVFIMAGRLRTRPSSTTLFCCVAAARVGSRRLLRWYLLHRSPCRCWLASSFFVHYYSVVLYGIRCPRPRAGWRDTAVKCAATSVTISRPTS